MIRFDYFTVTAGASDLRDFFFDLLRNAADSFVMRKRVLRLGGPAYRGWSFKGPEAPNLGRETGEFYVGQRRKTTTKGFDFIVTFPGAICKLFVDDFLKNSNVLVENWKITRIDLELTLDYRFVSKKQLTYFFWLFYQSQISKGR